MKQPKMLRLSEEAHRAAKIQAAVSNRTLEEWVSEAILIQAERTNNLGENYRTYLNDQAAVVTERRQAQERTP